MIDPAADYTTREVSEAYKIKEQTLKNWRAMGRGPKFHKIGTRAVRYSGIELINFRGQPRSSTSEPNATA